MRKKLTVALRISLHTDLPCIVCGGFRCPIEIVVPGADAQAHVGIHKGCLKDRVPRRARTSKGTTQAHQPEREDGP